MGLLAGTLYDPAVAVSKSTTAAIAMTALDTANLRLTFTAPASGNVMWRIAGGALHGATTFAQILLGVMEGSTVRARMAPLAALPGTALATTRLAPEAVGVITGLTPGNNYTFDAAYGVEIAVASTGYKYGGPNNTTTNDAYGGIAFEIWEA